LPNPLLSLAGFGSLTGRTCTGGGGGGACTGGGVANTSSVPSLYIIRNTSALLTECKTSLSPTLNSISLSEILAILAFSLIEPSRITILSAKQGKAKKAKPTHKTLSNLPITPPNPSAVFG
jgi:hypothetical protein